MHLSLENIQTTNERKDVDKKPIQTDHSRSYYYWLLKKLQLVRMWRLLTSDTDRSHILTYNDGLHSVRIKIFILAVGP